MPNHVHLILTPRKGDGVRRALAPAPRGPPWSSARAHLAGRDGGLATVARLLDMVGDWAAFLAGGLDGEQLEALRRHEGSGRPLGGKRFIAGLEARLGRTLATRKPGPTPKEAGDKSGIRGTPGRRNFAQGGAFISVFHSRC